MTTPVNRVGIVAKHGLLAASEHLARLGAWLRERRIAAVYETGDGGARGRGGAGIDRSRAKSCRTPSI